MRGRFAAALAAVLVGISSPAALGFAALAAVACVSAAESSARGSYSLAIGRPGLARSTAALPAAKAVVAANPESPNRSVRVFRSASGPAPSQAPPARA
jgi:hypothetical protein